MIVNKVGVCSHLNEQRHRAAQTYICCGSHVRI